MLDEQSTQNEMLNRYMFSAIVQMFSKYQSNESFSMYPGGKKPISHAEALEALQYAISKLDTLEIKF